MLGSRDIQVRALVIERSGVPPDSRTWVVTSTLSSTRRVVCHALGAGRFWWPIFGDNLLSRSRSRRVVVAIHHSPMTPGRTKTVDVGVVTGRRCNSTLFSSWNENHNFQNETFCTNSFFFWGTVIPFDMKNKKKVSKMIFSKKSHHFHLRGLCKRGRVIQRNNYSKKKTAATTVCRAGSLDWVPDVLHLEVVLES